MSHFRNIQITGVSDDSYKDIESFIDCVKATSRLTYKSIYIVDLFKQNFLYVSNNALFFSGHSREEIETLGFDFLIKNVPPEDLNKISEINDKSIELIRSIPLEDRINITFVESYKIIDKETKKIRFFNHQATPLKLSSTGNLWLLLCVESIPTIGTVDDVIAYSMDYTKIWKYDSNKKNWNETEWPTLKKIEKEILKMSAMGFSIDRIAMELHLSCDTIKFHRKEIFKRFGAKSINEAINAASTYRMI